MTVQRMDNAGIGVEDRKAAVAFVEGVLARLRAHGTELIGEVVRYENSCRLCCPRGPQGSTVALSERIS